MKKIKSQLISSFSILAIIFTSLSLSSLTTTAAPQTTRINPTTATVGTAEGTVTSALTQPVVAVYGGQVQNPNNILQEDGNLAIFDPSTTINGVDDNSDSYLYLDYQKNTFCANTVIQSITVHAKWLQNLTTPQNDAAALLVNLEDTDQLKFSFNMDNSTYTVADQVFGGIINPAYGGSQSSPFSGNPPSTLTEQTGNVTTLPTLAQFNDPNTRIYVTLGENPGGVIGQADSVWLEVTHDDAACADPVDPTPTPTPVTTTPTRSPKTGLDGGIIIVIAAVLAPMAVTAFIVYRNNKQNNPKGSK